MNLKIDVQRVGFNLCKSGLGAAYRARIYWTMSVTRAQRWFGAAAACRPSPLPEEGRDNVALVRQDNVGRMLSPSSVFHLIQHS